MNDRRMKHREIGGYSLYIPEGTDETVFSDGLALVAATLRELWREWHDQPPEHPHVRMQRLREKEKARNVSNRPGRDA